MMFIYRTIQSNSSGFDTLCSVTCFSVDSLIDTNLHQVSISAIIELNLWEERVIDWYQMRQTKLIHWLLVDFLLYYNRDGVAMEMWPQIILPFHLSCAALLRKSRTRCDVTAVPNFPCAWVLLMFVWVVWEILKNTVCVLKRGFPL